MELTLLGSGDVTGVPPLFSDLETSGADARRRRPGLLVETKEATALFDIGPDVREQLLETGVKSLDSAFLTHFHHDHAGGIDDLGLVAQTMDIDVFATETATDHLRDERGYLLDRLEPRTFGHGEEISVGDLTVVPFPVAHGRPTFDTVGFAIYHGDSKAVYAPDVESFSPDRDAGTEYRNADLLFVEGSPLFRDGLFEDVDWTEMIGEANAERTVLIHVNEHLDGHSTAEMREHAEADGFELGRDFETYRP